jgi:hypothetical protein
LIKWTVDAMDGRTRAKTIGILGIMISVWAGRGPAIQEPVIGGRNSRSTPFTRRSVASHRTRERRSSPSPRAGVRPG